MDYILTVDGQVIDTSEGSEPIQFIQGQDQIIPGLERELYGMKVGEDKNVMLSPKDGYGEVDPEDGMDIPRSEFPPEIPLDPGTGVQLKTQEGETISARVAEVTSETIRLDFNHPLAGKDLHFEVRVIDLRQATPDELDHGHVHDGDMHDGHHNGPDED
jgi:FKBP-type peptidyl-prolyl cis-trans isomerase SlyD